MNVISAETTFHGTPLESIFKTSKKTIQEYVREIDRHCRYKSIQSQVTRGVVLDDRGPLIDLYEACVEQDAHLRAVLETVESQIIGERYMLARQNERGKYIKDVEETKKIQGSQFTKIIKGIVEAKWYGYTLLEIMPDINPLTGKLAEVNIIERRNVAFGLMYFSFIKGISAKVLKSNPVLMLIISAFWQASFTLFKILISFSLLFNLLISLL